MSSCKFEDFNHLNQKIMQGKEEQRRHYPILYICDLPHDPIIECVDLLAISPFFSAAFMLVLIRYQWLGDLYEQRFRAG